MIPLTKFNVQGDNAKETTVYEELGTPKVTVSIEAEKRKYFIPLLHYSLFGAAYFAQGANLIFGQSFEAAYLKDYKIDEDTIGLIHGLARIPFAVKIIFAILSDKFPLFGWGRRIPYFIIGSLISTITWFPLAYVSPKTQLSLYIILRLLQISGAAIQEVSCDALVSEVTPAEKMSFGQSLMEGTRSVALLVSGLSFGFLEDLGDYQYVAMFAIISFLCFVPIIFAFPLGNKEGSRHHIQKKKHAILKCSDFKHLLTPYAMFLMLLLFTNAIATASKVLTVQLYLKDELHVTSHELGYYAAAGNVGSLLGSLLYGWISHAHARGKITFISRYQLDKFNLILACLGQAGILIAIITCPVDWLTYPCFFTLQFFWSGWMIYSRALVLNYCPPAIAGSFAAIMFLAPNIGQVTGPIIAGGISKQYGPTIGSIITAIEFGVPGVMAFGYRSPPITTSEERIIEDLSSTITDDTSSTESTTTTHLSYQKLQEESEVR